MTKYTLLVDLMMVVAGSSIVEVYDPITGKWTQTTSLPQPLDHTAAASYNGKLYVVGGRLS